MTPKNSSLLMTADETLRPVLLTEDEIRTLIKSHAHGRWVSALIDESEASEYHQRRECYFRSQCPAESRPAAVETRAIA